MTDEEIIEAVQILISPYNALVTGLGPDAVNVLGDARAYLPSVYVQFEEDTPWETLQEISTLITNRVRVSRVLMEIKKKT